MVTTRKLAAQSQAGKVADPTKGLWSKNPFSKTGPLARAVLRTSQSRWFVKEAIASLRSGDASKASCCFQLAAKAEHPRFAADLLKISNEVAPKPVKAKPEAAAIVPQTEVAPEPVNAEPAAEAAVPETEVAAPLKKAERNWRSLSWEKDAREELSKGDFYKAGTSFRSALEFEPDYELAMEIAGEYSSILLQKAEELGKEGDSRGVYLCKRSAAEILGRAGELASPNEPEKAATMFTQAGDIYSDIEYSYKATGAYESALHLTKDEELKKRLFLLVPAGLVVAPPEEALSTVMRCARYFLGEGDTASALSDYRDALRIMDEEEIGDAALREEVTGQIAKLEGKAAST